MQSSITFHMLSLFCMYIFDLFEIYPGFNGTWYELQIQHLFPLLFHHYLLKYLSFPH